MKDDKKAVKGHQRNRHEALDGHSAATQSAKEIVKDEQYQQFMRKQQVERNKGRNSHTDVRDVDFTPPTIKELAAQQKPAPHSSHSREKSSFASKTTGSPAIQPKGVSPEKIREHSTNKGQLVR